MPGRNADQAIVRITRGHIRWIAADLDAWRPVRGQYDVVVNAFFLNRRLYPALRAAVRPGGS